MADIKSFKSTAGEVFVCFNERSHSYKLFLNMLKSAGTTSDTAIKNMVMELSKAINSAQIENQAKGIVANSNGSDGGLSHKVLTNITNKIDLIFNSLSGLKSLKMEPIEYKLDAEVLDVFGKKLEESLGAIINSKLASIPASTNVSELPSDFVDKIITSLNSKTLELGGLDDTLKKLQQDFTILKNESIKSNPVASIDFSNLNKKLTDLYEIIKNKTIVSTEAQSQQIATISHTTIPSSEPTVARDKLILEKEVITPSQVKTQQEPTAVAGKDMVMRYPAKNKKSKPNCFGKYLAGDIKTTPCLSCAWTNDCKTTETDTKTNKSIKPDCFGSHRGDLDCSVCQFDGECAASSK